MDGFLGGPRNLDWIAGGAYNERCKIHRRLRVGEKDGGFWSVLQLRLAGISDEADDFDRFLNVPADTELLAESILSGIVAVHKSTVDDCERQGVEKVAVIEVEPTD